MDKTRLPKSEFQVMSAVWQLKTEVTSDMIMKELNNDWKKTTLLSLLTRLCEREFLSCEKRGKTNYYIALVQEEDYISIESARFLKFMHRSSVKSLVASLYDGKAITKSDLEELEKFIKEVK